MKSFHDSRPAPFAPEWVAYPPQERMGAELKTMFESLTAGPMPDRLLQLADALEDAFQRGDLFDEHSLDA
jgi:hypothetical protein